MAGAGTAGRRGGLGGGALAAILVVAGPGVAARRPPEPRLDLILVTLDTVRSDRLGCYGSRIAETPVLDALAATGVRYARALAPAPLTLPAHASLMTGLDPPEHGLRDNGSDALPVDVPTLAATLSAAGYATAAFVASRVLDRRFGLARGFDHYDDRMPAEIVGEYGYPERDAVQVTTAALEWLGAPARRALSRPYFLWIHYYDPHAPYEPPARWRSDSPEGNYAGEIAYLDHELGRLLAALPGSATRRVVAVVGDHGEALGEHGERAHGLFLYRASLEVPMLVTGPGVPRGQVVDEVVATRRLAPTLLRLLEQTEAARGFGTPLPGLRVSEAAATHQHVYSETLLPATAYGWSALKAVSDQRWRLVVAPRPELYEFAADPEELADRLRDRPDVAARLRRALEAHEARMRPRHAAALPADPQIAASLRSLGYLSGASAPGRGAVIGGIDPKDGVPMLAELEGAKRDLAAGRNETARRRLEALVDLSPGNVPFLGNLARAQLASGRREEALKTFRRALNHNPELDFLHAQLAEAYFELERFAEARLEYERALALNPRLAKAWLGLAEMALKQGHVVEERSILMQAVEARTDSVAVFTRLAQLALADGEFETAERHLGRATGLAPAWAPAWLVWGDLDERRGLANQALLRYRRASAADPTNATALLRTGRLLLKTGRIDEGRSLLERTVDVAPGSAEAREARRWLDKISKQR